MAETLTPVESLAMALSQLAAFRGATVSSETVVMFAKRLVTEGEPNEAVIEACRRLELRARAEGESAFPSLGTLLEECRTVRRGWQRQRDEDQKLLDTSYRTEQRNMTKEEAAAFIARLKRDVEIRRRELREQRDAEAKR